MNKKDFKSLERLAKKNREESQARYEADTGKESLGKRQKGTRRHPGEEEERPKDPRYEGADRLFTEMKKKDRP